MQHTKPDFLLRSVGNRSGPGVRLISLFAFIEDDQVIKKILKHLGLWDREARPPPEAKICHRSNEQSIDYSDSQLLPSDDDLFIDVQYPEPFSA